MKIAPVRGMSDRSVVETALRQDILRHIIDFYKSNGFFQIETPIVEDIENIVHSDGGNNLSLIFEIMKRGDKLKRAIEEKSNLSDMALRYDLTLPLSRFYSANYFNLPSPFKVIQTGRVYRAERPQKGRLREFVQCDIDIIGDDSPNCEIELFLTSLQALYNIGFKNLTLVLNDKRILNDKLVEFGINKNDFESVCISLDKLDKIGFDGVKAELQEKTNESNSSLSMQSVDRLLNWLKSDESGNIESKDLGESANSLRYIFRTIDGLLPHGYSLSYSPVLVRGQSYYTGVVAEIHSNEFSSSIGGGGRYDGMVEKFLGKKVSAVGISIGFERIMNILLEKGYDSSFKIKKIILLYSQADDFAKVLQKKREFQEQGYYVYVFKDVKNRKKLFDDLLVYGINCYCDFKSGKIIELKNNSKTKPL